MKRYADMTDDELLEALPQLYRGTPEEMAAFRANIIPRLEANDTFSFDGDGNCEDGCDWNGIDTRCSCGNRRVCWTCDHGSWRAEAY